MKRTPNYSQFSVAYFVAFFKVLFAKSRGKYKEFVVPLGLVQIKINMH